MSRSLAELDPLALFIDGVVIAGHTVVVALGLDSSGTKRILGLWEGATENAAVCRSLLSDLVARGLRYEQGILVVLDGSKALRAAVRDVFGDRAVVQRCQVHKKRNVLEHLPKHKQAQIKRKLDVAWRESDPAKAQRRLLRLAEELEKDHPGAAASLREGLEETLTVQRLRLPGRLAKSLTSTNIVESAIEGVRKVTRNTKRWSSGDQVLRWTAAGLLVVEKRFHRLSGYREMPLLRVALQRELLRRADENVSRRATA